MVVLIGDVIYIFCLCRLNLFNVDRVVGFFATNEDVVKTKRSARCAFYPYLICGVECL